MVRLFFLVLSSLLVLVLQISFFGAIPLILAYLLYILFFTSQRDALVLAFILGFFHDLYSPSFGNFLATYPFVVFVLAFLSQIIITNKSFIAFTLLGVCAFLLFEILLIIIALLDSFLITHVSYQVFSMHYLRTLAFSFLWYLVIIWLGYMYEAKKRIF